MTNPLLDFSALPRFDQIRPEHVRPAIEQVLGELRHLVAELQALPAPGWDNFVAPLEAAGESLDRAWGVVAHMHGVMDLPDWRDAYNAMLPEVTRFYAELGQNLALFGQYRKIFEGSEFATLAPARQRIIENAVRDFRLSGAELPDDQKPRFQEIQERLSALGAKFSENLLDATNAHAEWIEDEAQLAGIPEDVVAAARAAAEQDGREGWKFTLHMPSYLPVMQYAEDRGLRERLYRAYGTRASEFGEANWDNSENIREILRLRAEEAHMLGYKSYAAVSLVPKMAESPDQVLAFLHDMARRAKPFAERDLAELRDFAASELGLDDLQPWDAAWASEKLKHARYSFSDELVRQYLPEDKVLQGLFRVIERLYGVTIAPAEAATWHDDVRFFGIHRDGALVGQFYLDLYARATKRGGAWMGELLNRRHKADQLQAPVAYLVCNFSAPVGGQPARFTHDEVITLFHECGHGLHHLLTQVDEPAVSGIHGVEWDAVELPSQFMENFCWEWDVLTDMSSHARTGEPLPRDLFDRMIAAKNFQSGMQTVRQLEFALFDLMLHGDPEGKTDAMALIRQVRDEVAVIHPPEWHRFPHSFSHIFAGGYAAGYYSYKWAEVLSADAFAAFEEAAGASGTVLDRSTGERFWKEILAVGGSRPAIESFRAFRGRDPQPDALLRHSGMQEAKAA
ncbi:MAG: M3 family metallopeptidase [Rhodocyclaceae bacterium]|nr:M3 family metallopeptidase [Rhodocyclaceae bacterium]